MTPERYAQLQKEWDELLAPFLPKKIPPRPKVVTSDGKVIRDAEVKVSPADIRNMANSQNGTVIVRRADFVTVNMAAYEQQQADKARDRAAQRARDPYRLGLYGKVD
jgi:hypothetical protein